MALERRKPDIGEIRSVYYAILSALTPPIAAAALAVAAIAEEDPFMIATPSTSSAAAAIDLVPIGNAKIWMQMAPR